MKIKEIAEKYGFDAFALEAFIGRESEQLGIKTKGFFQDSVVDEDVEKAVEHFKKYKEERTNKQAALEEKRKEKLLIEEQMDANCTTSDSFENSIIEKYLGVVIGEKAYATHGGWGGLVLSQEEYFEKAYLEAKNEMVHKALALGANAIIGMRVSSIDISNEMHIIVVTSGTAVVKKLGETAFVLPPLFCGNL